MTGALSSQGSNSATPGGGRRAARSNGPHLYRQASALDGLWKYLHERDRIRIAGQGLTWILPGEVFAVQGIDFRGGKEVTVHDGRFALHGTLSDDGMTIEFEDGDTWSRSYGAPAPPSPKRPRHVTGGNGMVLS